MVRPIKAHHFNPLSAAVPQSPIMCHRPPPCLGRPPLGCVLGTAGVSWQSSLPLGRSVLSCLSQPWNRHFHQISILPFLDVSQGGTSFMSTLPLIISKPLTPRSTWGHEFFINTTSIFMNHLCIRLESLQFSRLASSCPLPYLKERKKKTRSLEATFDLCLFFPQRRSMR